MLIWKLKRGNADALCRIYEKYRDDLVRIAAGLLNDVGAAEDVLHDVFLVLVRSAGNLEIRESLKGYLMSCVANRARNLNRTKRVQETVDLNGVEPTVSNLKGPDQCVICDEEFKHLYNAITQLPYEQKEAVLLRIQGSMKFKDIANLQATSIKTTLSRYSYGLDKLRTMLNKEAEK